MRVDVVVFVLFIFVIVFAFMTLVLVFASNYDKIMNAIPPTYPYGYAWKPKRTSSRDFHEQIKDIMEPKPRRSGGTRPPY
ncbi:MAG: hypothetical protein COU47_03195 [Candidatus Niyogibacteria bacterium CG10_big_fil_rev_8_21_14_0_10_46_36]|uniref:Transmembrane protein n=1 Tax=Candidatus Niyogibacteria bacterium CG10_big_fil_rev_8_21_14_0_10_46_36 TaxID=1974726 RepID=A0A2H0TCR5_9BACT|nr:MAG: hypothetical protein COU47_03195 [Candidatus Niyogibacteria bacterium CG10_big_fil_rev_8_21_14_0_10_46_36]